MVQRCWAAYALHGRQALGPFDHFSGAGPAFPGSALAPDIRCRKGARLTQDTHGDDCAVHSPIPRIERSLAIASSNVWLGLNKFGSAKAAAATADSARARAAGIQANELALFWPALGICV
jgi:hypothetical protein